MSKLFKSLQSECLQLQLQHNSVYVKPSYFPSLLPHRDYKLGEPESSPYRTDTFKSEKHWCYLSFAHKSLLHVKWEEKTKKTNKKQPFKHCQRIHCDFIYEFLKWKDGHILHFLVYVRTTKELDSGGQFHAVFKKELQRHQSLLNFTCFKENFWLKSSSKGQDIMKLRLCVKWSTPFTTMLIIFFLIFPCLMI